MRGRYRIIDEHELATLKRKAAKADYYDKINAAKAALKQIKIEDRTYHQYASMKDVVFIHNYPVLPINNWCNLCEKTPEEGDEVLFMISALEEEENPNGTFMGVYYGDVIIVADFNNTIGYYSKFLDVKDYENIRWKYCE